MKYFGQLILFFVFASLLLSGCLDPGSSTVDTSPQEQFKSDTTAIRSYIKTNNLVSIKDISGVSLVMDQQGSGFPPKQNSTLTFKYKGYLLSGAVFDQGTLTGKPTDYILGFQIGLPLIPEGSKARLFIPSYYGYGTNAVGGIPPNSVLLFELELTDVVETDAEKNQLKTDTVAINTYLNSKSIVSTRDNASGLRYVITNPGSGNKPNLYSKIKITYTGKLLSDGTTFYTGTQQPTDSFDSRVVNFIRAFQVIVPKLSKGGKATIYVPSGLGFGSQPTTSGGVTVPANSNLIYDIELLDFQ